MRRDSLLDFFEDFSTLTDVFVVDDDGYRVRTVTYRQVAAAARRFAAALAERGLGAGDPVVLWSENRAEWIAALWGCLLRGAVVVPVDYRASGDLLARIAGRVEARLVLTGAAVEPPDGLAGSVVAIGDAVAFDGPEARSERPDPVPELAEIIFTSGATAEPKGVTISHRNVLANIVPIEREIAKYRRYARPFHPLRFLNLLPLSHLFGQSMATFVPPMIGGTVVFSASLNPAEILRQIRTRRVSVLVAVPKVLDVLREHVAHLAPETTGPDDLAGRHWLWRWWRYRRVHRMFGWKFWCFVVGAAPLDPELEGYWRRLGFLVVQGYGLTETAPIVTLNHPFRASKGTVGRPMPGVEVRIAEDGEILVRGGNVTSGYWGEAAGASEAFEGGWFHTGDIGELDETGRLVIRGRKKEMIVTPQGLNVFPEDVERALEARPGVREAAVVGVRRDGEERVHAVLVLEPGADQDAIVRGANATLEDHQRVRSASVWPGDTLPRTEGTRKLKRRQIQQWAAAGPGAPVPAAVTGATVEAVVARAAPGRDVTPETTIEELGLSSLDRVELMMALEQAFQTTVDEAAFAAAATVADLKRLVEGDAAAPASGAPPQAGTPGTPGGAGDAPGPVPFPSWNRSRLSRLVRRVSLPTWILPLARPFLDLRVEGTAHLADLAGPVIFAANHQSHMDTPAILLALPPRWRYRVAPAMSKEFFRAHFAGWRAGPRRWLWNSLWYYLACQFFGAFPLPQREAARQTLRYTGDVLAGGDSILIFPEGRRMGGGGIDRFRGGVGMMGARLGAPVVPVRIEGLDRVLDPAMRWPRRGPVRVAFGAPLRLAGDDYAAEAARVEAAVRAL